MAYPREHCLLSKDNLLLSPSLLCSLHIESPKASSATRGVSCLEGGFWISPGEFNSFINNASTYMRGYC